MELIDRYLQAVKFWLPKAQSQDIIAELSDDIRAQIEEKEAELARPLARPEVEAILRKRGRPVLVANRFLPQQYLIGPVLFPIYRFVLKIVALCYLIPWILVWISPMIFSQTYRAAHSNWGTSLLSASSSLWFTAFIALGAVTIVFAALERAQQQTGFLEDWDPQKLPPVRDSNRIPRSSSITELIVGVFFVVWWVDALWSQTIFRLSVIQITLAPAWRYFFWGFLLLSIVNIALAATNLLHPYWTRPRAAVRLASDFAGSATFCWFLKANILAEINGPNIVTSRAIEATNAINLWMSKAFPAAVVVCAVVAAFDVYRIIRVRGTVGPLMPQPTSPVILS